MKILGITVQKFTIPVLLEQISDFIQNNKHAIVANHNMHSMYIYHHDAKMRSFYARSNHIFIDGMPLVFIGRLLGHSITRDNRTAVLDWMPQLLQKSAREGWRIFYLGSKPGIAEKGATILKSKYTGLQMNTFHGYFDANPQSDENQRVVSMINAYRPHIVLVGMGMPRQEEWIDDNFDIIKTNVIFNVGAYIDYAAGAIPTPPRWVGRVGFEWLYRLLSEPKRLWRRYLVEPWFIVWLLIRDITKQAVDKKQSDA